MDVQINPRIFSATAGIAAGATASPAIVLSSQIPGAPRRGAIQLPSTWVTCTATFKGALVSGGSYVDLYSKDGTQTKIASTVASRLYELPDACLVGVYAIKVIKSTKQTTTAGGAVGANAMTVKLVED